MATSWSPLAITEYGATRKNDTLSMQRGTVSIVGCGYAEDPENRALVDLTGETGPCDGSETRAAYASVMTALESLRTRRHYYRRQKLLASPETQAVIREYIGS
jgi:hypothetical protein